MRVVPSAGIVVLCAGAGGLVESSALGAPRDARGCSSHSFPLFPGISRAAPHAKVIQ